MAISGLLRTVCRSSGTRARAIRSGSPVQTSGRNSRNPTITGTSREASVTETSVTETSDWQFAVLPSDEAYCGATPTEWSPFLGRQVSSMTRKAFSPPTNLSAAARSAASSGVLSQTPSAVK